MGTIEEIYRYPIKGLTAEKLEDADLNVDDCLTGDRAYAIENGQRVFDANAPRHIPKSKFLVLARFERLAALETSFDAEAKTLTISRNGKQVAKGNLQLPVGRKIIEQFFSGYMGKDLLGAPHIVTAKNHSFSDVPEKCLSIINLASIRDLERILGEKVHPLRFRGNLYIDGIEPWAEFNWVGKTVLIDGEPLLNCFQRIKRCPAVNVNPETAARDMSIPARLSKNLQHSDLGVYAMVKQDAHIKPGATITVEE